MKEDNVIQQKSYAFALKIVFLCRDLIEKKKEFILSKQLLKSGTSIGANVEEAQQAQSRNDFIFKLSIALKEAYESRYWLHLLRDTHYGTQEQIEPLLREVHEIIAP